METNCDLGVQLARAGRVQRLCFDKRGGAPWQETGVLLDLCNCAVDRAWRVLDDTLPALLPTLRPPTLFQQPSKEMPPLVAQELQRHQ